MALNYQIIKIPMVSGVDTKIDPKQLPMQKLSVLENARFDKVGSINKRPGSGASIGTGNTTKALYRRGKALLSSHIVTTGVNNLQAPMLWARDDANGDWQDKTTLVLGMHQIRSEKASVYGRATTSTSYIGRCDYAYVAGVEVAAFEDGTSVFTRVVSATNGVLAGDSLSLSSCSEPRLVAAGGKVFLFYRSAANTISCRYLTLSTGDWTTVGSAIATDYATAATGTFDVAPDTSTAHIIVAWNLTASNGYKVTRISSTDGSVVTAAVSRTNYDIGVAVAPCPDGKVVVISASTTDVYADIFASTLVHSTGATDIANITGSGRVSIVAKCKSTNLGSGVYGVHVAWQGALSTNIGIQSIVYRTDNTTTSSNMFSGPGPFGGNYLSIASKWWEDSTTTDMYLAVAHDGEDGTGVSVYPTLFVMSERGYFHGRLLPGAAAGRTADDFRHFFPSSVVALSSGEYRMAQVEREGVQDQVDSTQSVQVVSLKMDDGATRKAVEMGGSTYIPGAWLWQFDGQRSYEHGFSMYPVRVTAAVGTGSGNFTGTHSYKVVYERRTASGEVERSAPSATVVATYSGVNDTAVITVPTYVTGNQADGDVYIVLYRTEIDPGPDSLFYRVSSIVNDSTVSTTTFVDVLQDTDLINNAIDYFASGELEHIPPPPAHVIGGGKDRLFLSDGKLVYYSKLRNPGEPVAFTEANYLQVPQDGGDITGLAVMGDLLIVFRENAIYYVSGDGPNNLGQGAFGSPQLASLDVGCSDQRSIAHMPLGLMFKSGKGIYLLDRNLQVSYIGAPVEDYNSQDVTATLLHEDKNEVRFLTSSGSVLVYDYFASQWGVDTGRAGVGLVQVNGTIYYATAAGAVYAETPATFTDNSAGYSMKATTGWVKVDSLHGWMKVRRFLLTGYYKSAGTIRVRVAYDYNETFIDTYNYSLVNETPMKFRGRLSRMKCSAVKLEISDTSPTGEGFSLSEIALEVGIHPGFARLGSAHTVNET